MGDVICGEKVREFGVFSKMLGSKSQLTTSQNINVNQSILKSCSEIYNGSEFGLVKMADCLGIHILPPRKKITVMLMGNHSAGKSTFINWYLGQNIQKTGVAIETQGFTFITTGKKREALKAPATYQIYPHFLPLDKFPGVSDYVTTEVSTSKERYSSLVVFVDTPGLVDGDMQYPFNVNESVSFLGGLCDLILIFFDPVGQALCKRTLDIVDNLNGSYSERMRFYLSKADSAGSQQDRQKVLMQITQELCKRPSLNRCGFEMPTIYVHPAESAGSYIDYCGLNTNCDNQIENVCEEIEKTLNLLVQSTLNKLKVDSDLLCQKIKQVLQTNSRAVKQNSWRRNVSWSFFTAALLFPLFLTFYAFFIHPNGSYNPVFVEIIGPHYSSHFAGLQKALYPFVFNLSEYYQYNKLKCWIFFATSILMLYFISTLFSGYENTLERKDRKKLENSLVYIKKNVMPFQVYQLLRVIIE